MRIRHETIINNRLSEPEEGRSCADNCCRRKYLKQERDQFNALPNDDRLKFMEPCAAYITFKDFHDQTRAIQDLGGLDKSSSPFNLLGDQLRVKQAPDPSDIQWHNYHYDDSHRCKMKCLIFSIVALGLFGMFLFFTWMSRYNNLSAKVFP
jgi:hypothetical protein